MIQKDSAKTGFQAAREITRQYAKSFYFASRFLPREKRSAAFCVYAICRLSDETVDSAGTIPDNLSKIKKNIDLAYSGIALKDDLLLAFRQTVNRYKIPKEYFEELMQGMRMDLKIDRYETFEDLNAYCYKVAGVVGLIMLRILGAKEEQANPCAVDLGTAMQLTNIIRDIKEDRARGRIYLPQEDLDSFGVKEEVLSLQKLDKNFKSLLKFQINRARVYYGRSESGIKYIEEAECRFVVLCMKEIYAAILDDIERFGYDVFSRRAHVNAWRKAGIALRIFLRGKYR